MVDNMSPVSSDLLSPEDVECDTVIKDEICDQTIEKLIPETEKSVGDESTKKRSTKDSKKVHACDFPGCKAQFSRPWKLTAHKCVHTGERPYKCNAVGCNKSYTNSTHLRRHEQISHKKPDEKGDAKQLPTFKCNQPGCGRYLSSHNALKVHLRRHEQRNAKKVKCPDCDEMFVNHNELKTHMFEHDGILPFKCELCFRCFLRHNDVQRHVKKHRIYKCTHDDCAEHDTVFVTYKQFEVHLDEMHPYRFKCDGCDKSFTKKGLLNTHKLSCGTDKNAKSYKCIVVDCNHTFKLYRNMREHVKHKHNAPRYKCTESDCNKTFIWKASFKKHQIIHHGVKENECTEFVGSFMDDKERNQFRKKRKDANMPVHSAAEILSDVVVDKHTKQQLIMKEKFGLDTNIMQQVISIMKNDVSVSGDTDQSTFASSNVNEVKTIPVVDDSKQTPADNGKLEDTDGDNNRLICDDTEVKTITTVVSS